MPIELLPQPGLVAGRKKAVRNAVHGELLQVGIADLLEASGDIELLSQSRQPQYSGCSVPCSAVQADLSQVLRVPWIGAEGVKERIELHLGNEQ